MAFIITNPLAGQQPIATTSTVKNHPLGTIVSAVDPTYGSGEFIYLEGATNTIVGSVVSYVAAGTTSAVVQSSDL